jgi:hypothetical protein
MLDALAVEDRLVGRIASVPAEGLEGVRPRSLRIGGNRGRHPGGDPGTPPRE